jgi:hypothetical protein
MSKIISNLIVAALFFFLCLLFIHPSFAKTLTCAADNNKTYVFELENNSKGEFKEESKWNGGVKSGIIQTIAVKNINKTDPSEDYLNITDGKYTITYSLRCVYE